MNTIKIILTSDGSAVDVRKNFPLIQGQFNNINLEVLVPTAILLDGYTNQHYIGEVTKTFDYDLTDPNVITALNGLVATNAGRTPEEGDTIHYVYNNSGTLTLYNVVYTNGAWSNGGASVPYFEMNNVVGTNVSVGAVSSRSNGTQVATKAYFMKYIKTAQYNGTEYAFYSRMLPSAFTLYSGVGQTNGLNVIVNVTNVVRENGTDTVENIVTSQNCRFDVLPSTRLTEEDPLDAGELSSLSARTATLEATMLEKQDKVDSGINIEGGNVVNAINKAAQDAGNAVTTANNANLVATAVEGRVSALEQQQATEDYYVGTMTVLYDQVPFPVPTQGLNAFVQLKENRAPRRGDLVIVVQQRADETDKAYRCKFNATDNDWDMIEIPPIELSENGTAGIVKGTYYAGNTNDTKVNIVGGEVKNIYVKDNNSNDKDVRDYLNEMQNGTLYVENATHATSAGSATNDGNGDNIVNTYQTKSEGATKQNLIDYALPRTFNDVLYFNHLNMQLQKEPRAFDFSDQGITTTISTIGETSIGTFTYTVEREFQLSYKNSYSGVICIGKATAGDETLELKVYVRKGTTLLASDIYPITLSGMTTLGVRVGNNFNALIDDQIVGVSGNVINVSAGDTITVELALVRETSAQTLFTFYDSSLFDKSKFFLNTGVSVITYRNTCVGEVVSIVADSTNSTIQSTRYYKETGGTWAQKTTLEITVSDDKFLEATRSSVPFELEIKLDTAGITVNDIGSVVLVYPNAVGINEYMLVQTRNSTYYDKDQLDFDAIKDVADKYLIRGVVTTRFAYGAISYSTVSGDTGILGQSGFRFITSTLKIPDYLPKGQNTFADPALTAIGTDQTTSLLRVTEAALGNVVVLRQSNGQIAVPTTPIANYDATSKSYVDGQIAGTSNPNLLINPDFAINQRGRASYTDDGTTQYTVDRWKIFHNANISATTITPQSNGGVVVSITQTTGGNYNVFAQDVENYIPLRGKTLTLTMKLSSVSGTFKIGGFEGTDTFRTDEITEDGTYTLTFTMGANASRLLVFLTTSAAATHTCTIDYAKLELGSVATTFTPPDPATELAKCQRYFYRIDTSVAQNKYELTRRARSAYSFYEEQAYFPCTMRTRPTVYVHSANDGQRGYLYNQTQSANKEISIGYVTQRSFQMGGTNGDFTANDILCGYIVADAEIY